VAHITFPVDIQGMAAGSSRSKRNVGHHTSDVYARSARLRDASDLRGAADVLNAGRQVVILAGRGALGATDALEAMAERLGAPIVKALLGKAAVPDDSPYTTGGIGLLGTRPSQEALEACDTLLMVGTSFPYIEFYPTPGRARAVQIEIDPGRIGLRYPVEVGLVGDSRRSLEALLPLVQAKADRAFLDNAEKGMNAWRALMNERERRTETPMKPQVLARELGERLRDDAVVCLLRQRHHHHLVGAPHPGPPGTDPRRVGQSRQHGERPAVCRRRADCLSRASGGRLCRRRRLLDAHG
jgi:pyruvate dehydrogenase (quinone)/pyruvate oxidase